MSINFNEHVLGVGPNGELPPHVFGQLDLPDAAARAEMQATLDDYQAGQDATDTAVASVLSTGEQTQATLNAAVDALTNDDPLHLLFRAGGALNILYRALAARNETTCRIVALGSSTTQGYNATNQEGYVHMLARKIQTAYPSSTGTEIPVGTLAGGFAPVTAPGVQVVNFGSGGSTSANYLDTGTSNYTNNIAALQPSMVIHMIGSNDWNTDVPPAAYKTNVTAAIDAINAVLTVPCVHVLIHQHSRYQATAPAYPFTAYRDALREIALANPQTVVHIDMGPDFARLGVPTPDDFALLDTDLIHLTDRGHSFLAEALRVRLDLAAAAAPSTATDPPPDPEPTLTMVTSDGFSGDSTAIGTRPTDVAFGGSPITPTVVMASSFATSGGTLTILGDGHLTWAHSATDVEASIRIVTGSTSTKTCLDSRNNGSTIYARAVIKGANIGGVVLVTNNGTGEVEAPGGNQPYVDGDTIAVRSYGDVHELRINDVVKATATVAGISSTGTRLFSPSAGTGAVLDDLKIAELTTA